MTARDALRARHPRRRRRPRPRRHRQLAPGKRADFAVWPATSSRCRAPPIPSPGSSSRALTGSTDSSSRGGRRATAARSSAPTRPRSSASTASRRVGSRHEPDGRSRTAPGRRARRAKPADVVIRGGRGSSFTREWLEADVAVVDGVVAGLGDYEGRETLDAFGPLSRSGFVDPHLHLESSKLLVDEFARLVLPLGTTAVVADPHEIADASGPTASTGCFDASSALAARDLLHGPSCVPASVFIRRGASSRSAISRGCCTAATSSGWRR